MYIIVMEKTKREKALVYKTLSIHDKYIKLSIILQVVLNFTSIHRSILSAKYNILVVYSLFKKTKQSPPLCFHFIFIQLSTGVPNLRVNVKFDLPNGRTQDVSNFILRIHIFL